MAITNKVLEFTLELTPGGIPPIIHASQGDVGRTFKANVVWNGSAASAYISGTTVKLRGKKPDKTAFDYSATLSGSAVTFSTTEQMTIISGPVECELVFTSGSNVVASANFVMCVEESPYNPDAVSESVVPGIEDLIEEAIGGDVPAAVDAWLDAHPEATTTVQDSAITKAKINTAFLSEIENAYVTPEMFGAVGDGVADDTAAFIAMVASETDTVVLRNTYLISTRVDITGKNILGTPDSVIHVKSGTVRDTVIKFISCKLYGVNFRSTFDQNSTWLDNTTERYSNSIISFDGDSLLSNCSAEEIEILMFTGNAAIIDGLVSTNCTQCLGASKLGMLIVRNSSFNTQNADNLAHAIYVSESVDFVEIAGCDFLDCDSYPIHIFNSITGSNCKMAIIRDCYIDSTVQAIATNADVTYIDNLIAESITQMGLYIGGTSPKIVIKDSTIKTTAETLIGFQTGTVPVIELLNNIINCQKLYGNHNGTIRLTRNVFEALSTGSLLTLGGEMIAEIVGNIFNSPQYTSAVIVSNSTNTNTKCVLVDNLLNVASTTLTWSRDGVDIYYMANNTMVGTGNRIAYGYTPVHSQNNNVL